MSESPQCLLKIGTIVTTQHSRRRPGARPVARAAAAVVLVAGLLVGLDVALAHGETARGARIAEFDLGGLSREDARTELTKLVTAAQGPVTLVTDSGRADVDPRALGLTFDVGATLDRLMEQPANPVARVGGVFGGHHDVAPVVHVDRAAFDEELDEHRATLEKAAVEGGVHFEGTTPVADMPSAGLRIDRDAAVETISREWLRGHPIELAMEPFDPTVSAQTVQATLDGPAREVTGAPVTLTGGDEPITVSPRSLGAMVTFVPDGKGGLKPHITRKALKATLGDELAGTESKAVDATVVLSGGSPRVRPSTDGARVQYVPTGQALAAASVTGKRTAEIDFKVLEPKLSTAAAKKLGVKEVVAEFTTGDFSGPSGENIRLVAQQVDGALVLPGETFSLNGYTGPRGTAQGYVTSTIIDHGHAAKAVGGGISQFATTLYNAAYFAGLEDVAHTEHAYYISRYPEAREATVFEGLIDLQFRNNTKHGILIETAWSPSSVTVRMWGTKTFDVESITGERTAPTSPEQITLPAGDDCLPSSGAPGFTASNTRVVRNAATGAEVSRHTRTVRYAPEPIVQCR
ncbi:VanW family protein [Gordonia sp. VNK21]|uniref:VanW family protein n=1 Tax=Gordonia sp. VNK21 TaxID=3382483 RepID=UPI0038D3B9CE